MIAPVIGLLGGSFDPIHVGHVQLARDALAHLPLDEVRFIPAAQPWQKERVTDEVHGNVIVYDSRNEFFTVQSGGPSSATPENPSGRVRVVIQPKTAESPGTASPSASAPLTPATRLQEPRK